jgi:hypothetical protein
MYLVGHSMRLLEVLLLCLSIRINNRKSKVLQKKIKKMQKNEKKLGVRKKNLGFGMRVIYRGRSF